MEQHKELAIIQHTHDLIHWYIPILNRMPLDFKLTLGRRIIDGLYNLLESLIRVKYSTIGCAEEGSASLALNLRK